MGYNEAYVKDTVGMDDTMEESWSVIQSSQSLRYILAAHTESFCQSQVLGWQSSSKGCHVDLTSSILF